MTTDRMTTLIKAAIRLVRDEPAVAAELFTLAETEAPEMTTEGVLELMERYHFVSFGIAKSPVTFSTYASNVGADGPRPDTWKFTVTLPAGAPTYSGTYNGNTPGNTLIFEQCKSWADFVYRLEVATERDRRIASFEEDERLRTAEFTEALDREYPAHFRVQSP